MFLKRNPILLIVFAFAAFLFAACDGADTDETGGGGGLADGYPAAPIETPVLSPVDEMPPATEEGMQPEMTATVEDTGTVEITETTTVEVTVQAGEGMGETAEETFVVLASEVIGMSIHDRQQIGGPEMGTVAELLMDDAGAIQYVIVELAEGSAVGTGGTELATPAAGTPAAGTPVAGTPVATTTGPITDTPGLLDINTVVVPWDSFTVEPDMAAQGPRPVGTPETTGSNENDTNENTTNENDNVNENAANDNGTNVNEANDNGIDTVRADPDAVVLVYTGNIALGELPPFNMQILDEPDFILDEEGSEEVDETAVPTEYTDLLQISEYRSYKIQNIAGEALGSVTDLLINLTVGEVVFLIVEVEGRTVPIPWNRLFVEVSMENETEMETMTLPTTADVLTGAPDIELSDWRPSVQPEWDAAYRTYWQRNIGS